MQLGNRVQEIRDRPGTGSPHPIGLLGLGIYLPERVMTNDEWTEYVDTSDEWIVSRTGIRTRRIASCCASRQPADKSQPSGDAPRSRGSNRGA